MSPSSLILIGRPPHRSADHAAVVRAPWPCGLRLGWGCGYFAMQRWLETFAYRVEPDPLVLFAAGVLTLGVAFDKTLALLI